MAKRYGGEFSPDGAEVEATPSPRNAFSGVQVEQSGLRAKLLFFAPLPLIFIGFSHLQAGNTAGLLADFGAFALLMLAAWLLRDGLRAQAAYEARNVARRPAFPRKIFASALTGVGVALAALDGGLVFAIVTGVLAEALHMFAFGIDPLKNKGMDGFDDFSNERVARAVGKGEERLDEMLAAIKLTKNRALEQHVEVFANAARDMFRTVETDPRDLSAARKYLGVYLVGARDATVKFAELYARKKDETARAAYEDLLNDLEKNFDAQREQLLLDDRSDLDVEIEVLRERLQMEGVRPSRKGINDV